MLGAEERSPGKPAVQPNADIPKGYEIGEKSVSPNGRFAILYPIRENDNAELHQIFLYVSNLTRF